MENTKKSSPKRFFGQVNLREGKEWKVLLKFALPIIFSYVLQQIYTISDAAICGQTLSADEVAGVNDVFPLTFIFLQFAFGNDKNNAYLPHSCDYNSIMYSGTHDNDTTIGWYATATEAEKDHYRRYLNVDGHDVAWDFIRMAISSPAAVSIVPLQDVLNLDSRHRMNLPGVAGGNWCFRFDWSQWDSGFTKGLYYLSTLFGRYAERPDPYQFSDTEETIDVE